MADLVIKSEDIDAVEWALQQFLLTNTSHQIRNLVTPDGSKQISQVRGVLREIIEAKDRVGYGPYFLMALGMWDMVSEEEHREMVDREPPSLGIARHYMEVRLKAKRSTPTLQYDPEVAKMVQDIHDFKSGRCGWRLLRLEEVFGVNTDLNIAKSLKEEPKKQKRR